MGGVEILTNRIDPGKRKSSLHPYMVIVRNDELVDEVGDRAFKVY